MRFLGTLFVVVALSACQSGSYLCPTPDPVKLRRGAANRMKLYKLQMQERAIARGKESEYRQLLKANEREWKKTFDIEEWDCPRPGTAHSRMIEKQRKKLEKQSEHNLKKKVEKPEGDLAGVD
jgi:hypothetical protein